MGAHGADRTQQAVSPQDHDRQTLRLDSPHLPLEKVLTRPHLHVVHRAFEECVVIHRRPDPEREMSAHVRPEHGHQPRQRRQPDRERAQVRHSKSHHQRDDLDRQHERHRQPVHHRGSALVPIGLVEVGVPGQRRHDAARHANRQRKIACHSGHPPGRHEKPVREDPHGPCPDRHVGERWVQRMAERGGPVHHVFDRLAGWTERLIGSPDRFLDRHRHRVEPGLAPDRAVQHPLP